MHLGSRIRILIGANLAADLAACRTRKAGFNGMHGDFSDAPQLCPVCLVGGLNAKACHDRGEVTGKVCRLDFWRELGFRLRLFRGKCRGRSRQTRVAPTRRFDRTCRWLRGTPKFFTQKKFSCGGPQCAEDPAGASRNRAVLNQLNARSEIVSRVHHCRDGSPFPRGTL